MRDNATYSAEILETSKDLTVTEKIAIKNTSDAIRLNDKADECGVDGFNVTIDYYATIKVHNEKSRKEKDYEQLVLVSTDGTKFVTGSDSFKNAFYDIVTELIDSDITTNFTIHIVGKPSNNYAGRNFITCGLIG